jgi:hypothetical protein
MNHPSPSRHGLFALRGNMELGAYSSFVSSPPIGHLTVYDCRTRCFTAQITSQRIRREVHGRRRPDKDVFHLYFLATVG